MSFVNAVCYESMIIHGAGVPLPNHPVTIYKRGTTDLAKLYTNETKTTEIPNPTTSDFRGNLVVFIDPGRYTRRVGGEDFLFTVTQDPSELSAMKATTQADDYTLALADAGTVVEGTKATAMTVTIPPDGQVAFPVGTIIEIHQSGAGQITISPGVGVTLNSPVGLRKLANRYSSATLRKRAANEWVLHGDLA